jgi:hypothetical protein
MGSSLQVLLDSMFRIDDKAEAWAARRDPVKHKLTRVMDKPMSYRYCPQKKSRPGTTVWWCWACHRNVAGYFLSWREVRHKNGTVRRDYWFAHRVKTRLKERARRLAAQNS